MNLVHIKDGIVVNSSVGDLQETQALFPDQLILESDIAGIGWTYDGSNLVPPYSPPPDPTPKPVKITRLAFRNRFTNAEKVSLYNAAKTTTQIQVFLDDVAAATFIDLTRPDTISGVNSLEMSGLLATGRADEILNTPPTQEEIY